MRHFQLTPTCAQANGCIKMKKIETILGHAPWRLEAWVDENQANRLTIGAKARFIAPGLPGKMNAKVVSIDQDTTRELPDGQLLSLIHI